MRIAAVVLCWLPVACQSGPVAEPPPPAATHATLWEQHLQPQALLRDLDQGAARAGSLVTGELNGVAGIRRGLRGTVGGEFDRVPQATASAGTVAAQEVHRLGALRTRLGSLPADRWLGQLGQAIEHVPTVLGNQRRPLAEASDRRHRVDPTDTTPEAGWLERLRRRILP